MNKLKVIPKERSFKLVVSKVIVPAIGISEYNIISYNIVPNLSLTNLYQFQTWVEGRSREGGGFMYVQIIIYLIHF